MRIALDAMGGDDGPKPNIIGAIAALRDDPDLHVVLVGEAPILEMMLTNY